MVPPRGRLHAWRSWISRWCGAANTTFWGDPKEHLVGLLVLQFMPSSTYPVVAGFKVAVYQSIVD
jgi:hypothetical protein